MLDSEGRSTYLFPYKDKKSIDEVVNSPLFQVVNSSASVKGTIKEKAFLYGGDSEPVIQDPSKMYLIEGDQVTVEDSIAGLCKISYEAKTKPITMWVKCNSIIFSKD